MADIFLSYAREDINQARLYAQAFERIGWTVFWDPKIVPGIAWDEEIEEQLRQCRCVVVLWSSVSVARKWVRNEASVGEKRDILVPVAIGDVESPIQFRHLQNALLKHWQGDLGDEAFAHLLKGIDRYVPRPGQPVAQDLRPQPPAFREDRWFLSNDPLLGFVEIPAGPFTMGSDKTKDLQARDDELPPHQVTLPAFFIGRYEVTVAQMKACAEDGGWTPKGEEALNGADEMPVVSISWHEALAYCQWLEETLKLSNSTPANLADALVGRHEGGAWRVTLPSEAEWEKAARGTDGRIYPWGDAIDPTKANYGAASRRGSTPVGSFPHGVSPYGLLDMAGNVWEWTRSPYSPYPYRANERERLKAKDVLRVVRGGSFKNGAKGVRAAVRNNVSPDDYDYSIGFRVVVSPLSLLTKNATRTPD